MKAIKFYQIYFHFMLSLLSCAECGLLNESIFIFLQWYSTASDSPSSEVLVLQRL